LAKSKIIDDKFTTIRNDIEKVQKAPTLYISYRGPEGVEHLAHEMVNNMVDEHRNPNTISDGIMDIFLDGETGMCYFKDHGRGINFDDLENAVTILQSGSKMDREFGGASGGEYGIGMTATAALSEIFEITSTRGGKSRFLKFRDGVKIQDTITDADKKAHGLTVGFKGSKMFLGEDAYLPIDSFSNWLNHIIYTLDSSIQIRFHATDQDGNEIYDKLFHNEDSNISGFITSVIGDIGYILPNHVLLSNSMDIIEQNVPVKVKHDDGSVTFDTTDKERTLAIEFAFNYSPKAVEPQVYGFTNMIEQIDGGVHVNAFKNTLSQFLLEKAEETMRKTENPNIITDDALTGLTAVVNLNTTMTTGFESQTKHKLGNKKFIAPLKKLYQESIEKHFDTTEGKKELKKLIEFVKLNAKIRTDAANKRKKVKTNQPTLMDSKLIGNYTAANLINTPKDHLKIKLELYLAEGDSAGGQLRKARFNPDYQGILNFTGKPDNFYNKARIGRTTALPPSNVYAILLDKILGCGYGGHFNIENLIYDKIIFGFDADVDGNHMAGLTLSSIWSVAPELITDGHCYRVVTPLYKVAESQAAANKMSKTDINPKDYLWTKNELFERFEQNALQYARIKFKESDDFISDSNMRRFLYTNRDYYQVLDKLSSFETVPMELIEFIAANPKTFGKDIKKLDAELNYKDGTISGCYKGEFTALTLSDNLMDQIKYLTNVIQVGNDGIYEYEFYDRRGAKSEFNHVGRMTIGEIMQLCQKYSPYIVNRYKGLGEMSKYEMYKFAMNPNYRRLVRYTVSDVERFESILDDLFLMNTRGRRVRKELVQTSNLTLDDIDN
jgi:DNA gyrase subunit B